MVDVISIHMPKTAGTAFRHILYDVYAKNELLEDYPPERIFNPSSDSVSDDVKIIHGHFQPATKYNGLFPNTKRIVWLRHPIFRLISEYFFAKTINDRNNAIHLELLEKKLSLLEFAKIPAMRNFQTRYIDGLSLEDFTFVGLQEFYAEDIQDLGKLLNWSAFEVSSKNANKYPKYQDYLAKTLNNTSVVNQLVDLNSEDMALYDGALRLRAQRRNESPLIQSTLAEWHRSQFLLSQVNGEVNALKDKVSQLEALTKLCFPAAGDVRLVPNKPTAHAEKVLGFGLDGNHAKLAIDSTSVYVRGWVAGRHSKASTVRAVCEGQVVSESRIDIQRPDVAAFLKDSDYLCSGFKLATLTPYFSRFSQIALEAVLEDGSVIALGQMSSARPELVNK